MFSGRLHQTWLRVKALWKRPQLDSDLEEELAFHLAKREERNRDRGLQEEEARYAARRQFGNVTNVKEKTREMWTLASLEGFLGDVRFGARTLRRNPGFTAVAVLTLALGIGANTAIFSVIDAVLLEPLPFRAPDRLVRIFSDRRTPALLPVNGDDYFDWVGENRTFEQMTLYTAPQNFNASGAGEPETVSVVNAEANFFRVIGVQPELGRAFADGEDKPGNHHVAILSYAFWQRHFRATPDAMGQKISLNFEAYTVVGVMPRTYNYPERVDIWIPQEMSLDRLGRRGNYSFRVLARLKPGVTLAEAQADMSVVAKNLEQQFPVSNSNLGVRLVPMKQLLTQDSRPQLLVLLGAVALVLLVASTNVANLLLARATGRQREIALRAALGASRWRLVRQLLTESVMLSSAGAALGLGGAWWLVKIAESTATLPIPRQNPMQLDPPVLVFTIGVSILVGILFGLVPALEASRPNLGEELKSSTGSIAGACGWRMALRNSLVVTEIATSLALLAGAGLLLRSFAEMRRADIGVRTQSILTAAVVLPDTKYTKYSERRGFYERLLERVENIPGVLAASISQQIPLEGSHGGTAKLVGDPDPRHEGLSVNWNFVSPSYFRVFGMPFFAGRDFTPEEVDRAANVGTKVNDYWESGGEAETTAKPEWATVAIINRTMAETLWPNQDPVGKVFMSGIIQPVTVVGIVGDEKYGGIREPAMAEVYFPFTEELTNRWYPPKVSVRANGRPENLLGGIRTSVRDLDSELSLFRVRTMEQVISDNMQDTTLETALLGSFAALGLLLSAVGIYGVMAYLVTQRTREIGVRVTLGAQRGDILQLVLGRGAKLAAAGVAIGVIAALMLTRLLSKELFGVSANDPVTFVGVSFLLTVVALLASYVPARRAMRVDPIVALRYE
jgi:predicted permease